MPVRRTLLALAALTTLAAAPTAAEAATPTVKKAIWGPVAMNGVSQFPIYRQLGAGIYETTLSWSNVATRQPADPTNPNDPAYSWPADIDSAVAQAPQYGMKVALMVKDTPAWANAKHADLASDVHPRETIPPDSDTSYQDFLVAAARRYPSVRRWMIWGEPIRRENWFVHFLTPAQKKKGVFGPLQRGDAHRYAKLLDDAYATLHRVSSRNIVIGGMTTTTGDLDPLNWIRNLKLPNGKPPRMDLFGHNPFGTRTPNLASKPLTKTSADFSDLDTFAGWLDKYLDRDGRDRKLRIFISEYNAPTDARGFEFNYHVTRAVQAKWLKAALRITRSDKRVATLGWQQLYDTPPRPKDGLPSNTGLIDLNGVRKPAFAAFEDG